MNSLLTLRAGRITTLSTLIGLAAPCAALPIEWANPGTGDFDVAANWNPAQVPGSIAGGNATNDEARVSNGGTAVIDATQAVGPQFVILAAATGTTGNLQMTGGTLTTTSDIRIGGNGGAAGGTGLFSQSGGDVLLNGGNVNIGFGDTAVGTYNLSGGTLALTSGTIFAVGNRGNGTVMQTGGSVYVRGPLTGAAAGTGLLNLGRNGALTATNPGVASGSYTLSGGELAVAQLRYGNNATGALTGSTNVFNLQGTGSLTTGTISIVNTNASNSFNFTGGTLTTTTVGLPLTNNGGTLSPATLFFGNATTAPPLTTAGVITSAVGTTTFTLANSYNQGASGTYAIDIAAPGSNDFVDIGADPNSIVTSTLAGTLVVSLLDGFEPAFGSTFDVLTADIIANSALVTGPAGFNGSFVPSVVSGADGRQVLRLTLIPEPGSFALFAGAALALSVRRSRRAGKLS